MRLIHNSYNSCIRHRVMVMDHGTTKAIHLVVKLCCVGCACVLAHNDESCAESTSRTNLV
jgi:hypothetical protein